MTDAEAIHEAAASAGIGRDAVPGRCADCACWARGAAPGEGPEFGYCRVGPHWQVTGQDHGCFQYRPRVG